MAEAVRVWAHLANQAGGCERYTICNGAWHLPVIRLRNRKTLEWEWQWPPPASLNKPFGGGDKCTCVKAGFPSHLLAKLAEVPGS